METDHTYLYIFIVIIVVILIAVGIGVGIYFATKNNKTEVEEVEEVEEVMIDEEEMTNFVEPIELEETSTSRFSLYCVPAFQPPLTKEAKKYGGFHMTLFPSQHMPSNYSIVDAMRGFEMENQQWNLMLPGITTKVIEAKSKNLVIMMVHGATTLNTLRDYLQTPSGGSWKNPWSSNHLTLGLINPPDQAKPEDFTHQTTFYVQLVNKSQGGKWLPNERVKLYIAEGKHN